MYFTPEMEEIKIGYNKMLCGSETEPGYGGEGDPEENIPD